MTINDGSGIFKADNVYIRQCLCATEITEQPFRSIKTSSIFEIGCFKTITRLITNDPSEETV